MRDTEMASIDSSLCLHRIFTAVRRDSCAWSASPIVSMVCNLLAWSVATCLGGIRIRETRLHGTLSGHGLTIVIVSQIDVATPRPPEDVEADAVSRGNDQPVGISLFAWAAT